MRSTQPSITGQLLAHFGLHVILLRPLYSKRTQIADLCRNRSTSDAHNSKRTVSVSADCTQDFDAASAFSSLCFASSDTCGSQACSLAQGHNKHNKQGSLCSQQKFFLPCRSAF